MASDLAAGRLHGSVTLASRRPPAHAPCARPLLTGMRSASDADVAARYGGDATRPTQRALYDSRLHVCVTDADLRPSGCTGFYGMRLSATIKQLFYNGERLTACTTYPL